MKRFVVLSSFNEGNPIWVDADKIVVMGLQGKPGIDPTRTRVDSDHAAGVNVRETPEEIVRLAQAVDQQLQAQLDKVMAAVESCIEKADAIVKVNAK